MCWDVFNILLCGRWALPEAAREGREPAGALGLQSLAEEFRQVSTGDIIQHVHVVLIGALR